MTAHTDTHTHTYPAPKLRGYTEPSQYLRTADNMFPPHLLLLTVGGSLPLIRDTEILEISTTNSTLKALVPFLKVTRVFALVLFSFSFEEAPT